MGGNLLGIEATLPLPNKRKDKVVPVLFNRASRHEGVLGECRYSSAHSSPWHYMEVSCQLHSPSTLPPGKESLVHIA